jgi:hypothetical protein
VSIICLITLSLNIASASTLWLDPADQVYDLGESITIDVYATIDESDAIVGFGFDLSFDNGASYVSGPGATGSYAKQPVPAFCRIGTA